MVSYVDEFGNESTEETDYFDAKKYLSFNCKQDVNILAAGFDEFRELCLRTKNQQIDITRYLRSMEIPGFGAFSSC